MTDNRELALVPHTYYPLLENNNFIDNAYSMSTNIFLNEGVKCPCSINIFKNKYTFMNQHCKTKKHIKWLNSISENKDNIIKENVELKKELRESKIKEQKTHNHSIRYQKEITDVKNNYNNLKVQNNKYIEDNKQLNEYTKILQDKYDTRKKRNKELKGEILKLKNENNNLKSEIENKISKEEFDNIIQELNDSKKEKSEIEEKLHRIESFSKKIMGEFDFEFD